MLHVGTVQEGKALRRNLEDLLLFIAKRLAIMVLLVVGVTFITFLFSHVMVSDPARLWAGRRASAARVAEIISLYHLNQPVYVQYYYYIAGIFTGNLGYNPTTGAPILPQILHYFPATLELVLAALVIMIFVGIPLGALAASRNGKATDHAIRAFYLSGWATPSFLGALVLSLIFTAYIHVLPTQGMINPQLTPPRPITGMYVLDSLLEGNLPDFVSSLRHLILPAVTLAFLNFGVATRMTRASMLEVIPLDYIKSARSKGLKEWVVIYRHALRNALTSTVTVLALLTGSLLSGTVVVEDIFGWPGIGEYAYQAVTSYNFPVIIAVTVVFSVGVIISNLIADVLYAVLDPRVEWG
ncbi:MAG: ABC transporter permease [Methanomassiliicoccales archaeon]